MKHKLKRILSAALACAMVLAMLPATALAKVSTSDTSTVTFVIVNGTWNNVNFGRDAVVSDDQTTVTFTTYYSDKVDAYVYRCSYSGGTMERMLAAILNGTGEGSDYIVPDEGYTLSGMSTQDWTVNEGGGLKNNSGKSANAQMALIQQNTHYYDDHGGDEKDGFIAGTVYTLTLTKSSYTVTWADSDETVLDTEFYQYQDTPSYKGSEPTKASDAQYSYTFSGWSPKVGPVTKDITYTATYTKTAVIYTIAYDLAGGALAEGESNPTAYSVESDPITLNNPVRTGYTFAGWTGTDLSGAAIEVTIPTGSTGNRSYTAVWTANTGTAYTVEHYKQNLDGTYPTTASETENKSGTTGEPTEATAKSYEGFTAQTFRQETIAGDGTTVVKIYYDRNTYTVEYDLNGGATTSADTRFTDVRYGADTPTVEAPTREGYVFSGWSPAVAEQVTDNAVYTAQWEADHWKDDDINGDSETGGDGIPDKYQALIKYMPANSEQGVVSPTVQVVTLPVNADGSYAVSGTAALSSNASASSGYAFDCWLAPDSARTYDAGLAGSLTVEGGKEYTYTAYFGIDGNGDDIPDKYQVFVNFEAADSNGTVTTKSGAAENSGISQVYTFADHAVTGDVTPTLDGVAVSADSGYAFDIWTKDSGTDAVNPAAALTNVSGGTTITFKAHFDTDEIGGDNGGDGTPDKYQATVTYKIVNGTWSDGTALDKTEVFTLKTKNPATGAWDAVSPAPTLNGTIPTGMTADADYSKSEGCWGVRDDAADDPTETTVVEQNLTYVYAFGARNTWTVTITVENGSSDATSPVTVEHGDDRTVTFQADPGYVLDSVIVNGEAADLTDETYTFANVTADQNIKVVYAYDGKGQLDNEGKETGDGIADKYQVFVWYRAGANGSLEGTVYQAYDLRQAASAELKTSVELAFPTPSAGSGYQFSSWTNPADVTVAGSVMSGFTPGQTYTFTANFNAAYRPPVVVIPDPTVKVKGLNTVDHVTYIIGVGQDRVNPLGTITRAEIANIYFRLMTDEFRNANWGTVNRFRDVPDDAWYAMAVLTLDKAGVITDSDDGSFRPYEPITRAELAVMAAQFCTITGRIPAASFEDVPVSYWAADEIALVEYAGWIEGYEGKFYPDDHLSRAEAMTIVNRMLQRGAEDENMLPGMLTWVDNANPDIWYYDAIQEATNAHDYTRTNVLLTGEQFCGEKWTALLKATDWAGMEKAWIEAHKK